MAIFIMTRLPGSLKPMLHVSALSRPLGTTYLMKPTAFKIQNDTFIANRALAVGPVAVNPRDDEPKV